MRKQHFLSLLLLGFTPLTLAHGIWVAERVGEPTIVYGHGAGDDPYKPEKITYSQAFDSDGKAISVALNQGEHNVGFASESGFASVALVMDNGYWTEQEDGHWVNKPKNEVEHAKSAGHYVKNALSIVEHGKLPSLDALSALDLLIMPQGDVIDTHMGEHIEVTVYFQGKPLSNAEIIGDYVNDDETIVATTDANGNASVPVRNKGLNVLAVDHKIDAPASEQDKADRIGYNATLSFNNDHHEH